MSLRTRQRRFEPSEGCIATIASEKRDTQPTEQRGDSTEGNTAGSKPNYVPIRLPRAGGTEDAIR